MNGSTTTEQVNVVFDAAFQSSDSKSGDQNLEEFGSSDLTDLRKVCSKTIEAYIAEIAEITVQL